MSIKSSTVPARELVAKYGSSRATVRHVMYNRFSVAHYLRCMSAYKILPCSGSYFKDHLKDGMFYGYNPLTQENISFHIVYRDCTPSAVKKAEHVVLSFRIAHEDFNIEPVVMVQIGRM